MKYESYEDPLASYDWNSPTYQGDVVYSDAQPVVDDTGYLAVSEDPLAGYDWNSPTGDVTPIADGGGVWGSILGGLGKVGNWIEKNPKLVSSLLYGLVSGQQVSDANKRLLPTPNAQSMSPFGGMVGGVGPRQYMFGAATPQPIGLSASGVMPISVRSPIVDYTPILRYADGGPVQRPVGGLEGFVRYLFSRDRTKDYKRLKDAEDAARGARQDEQPVQESPKTVIDLIQRRKDMALNYARGGLAQTSNFVRGGTQGQADKVRALLSDGEYVVDSDVVSALGDGNNEAGARQLDRMRHNVRKHKRSAPPTKIPPKAKAPTQYMKGD